MARGKLHHTYIGLSFPQPNFFVYINHKKLIAQFFLRESHTSLVPNTIAPAFLSEPSRKKTSVESGNSTTTQYEGLKPEQSHPGPRYTGEFSVAQREEVLKADKKTFTKLSQEQIGEIAFGQDGSCGLRMSGMSLEQSEVIEGLGSPQQLTKDRMLIVEQYPSKHQPLKSRAQSSSPVTSSSPGTSTTSLTNLRFHSRRNLLVTSRSLQLY